MNICPSKKANSSWNSKNTIDRVGRVGYLPRLYRPLLCSGPAASHWRTAGFFNAPYLELFKFLPLKAPTHLHESGDFISLVSPEFRQFVSSKIMTVSTLGLFWSRHCLPERV